MNEPPLELQDVILPAAGSLVPGWLIPSGLVLLAVAFAAGRFIRAAQKEHTSPATVSSTEDCTVEGLRQQWLAHMLDDRQVSFLLARLLCRHLQAKELPQACPERFADMSRQWKVWVTAINALRYQGVQRRIEAEFFDWVQIWLQRDDV